MVKPGDVVAFKDGHLGIAAPNNLGIMVRRERRKGTPWVELITINGKQEMKAEHLQKRAFKQRYDGPLGRIEEAQSRLKHLISQHSQGALEEEAEDDLGALEESLWYLANDGEPRTDEQLAALLHDAPSPQQLRDVKAALDRCRKPGVGRFETAGKGDTWRARTEEELEVMRAAWHQLGELRRKLIVQEDTEEGRAFVRQELADAHLDAADNACLQWVAASMQQFMEHDGVPDKDIAGIGGLGAVSAFGMDLHRQLGFLAQDWIRSEHTTRSSDYVHFLIESGLWTPRDAVGGLTRRHVNQEPFFEHVPDPDAAEAAEGLPEPAMENGRTDLRHLECYTIDPPDAKDFDDAVGIEDIPGAKRLWVHIADVSHYVQQGSLLDRHAKNRATSVYLPGVVLPMLPARIADHLCSLRDDGDRFAMSISMDVKDGVVVDAAFYKSLIRVNENLHYQHALDRRDEPAFGQLLALAKQMQEKRGGLRIETGELRVEVADAFEATTKHGNEATRMIESFMVAANEAVAKHLADKGLPLLYRCHPMPDPQKADKYSHQLETMGLDVPFDLPSGAKDSADGGQSLLDALKSGGGKMQLFGGGMDLPPEPEPEAEEDVKGFAALSEEERRAWLEPFHAALTALEDLGSARAEVATGKLLACMGQAYYTPENEGHFGLASTHYCHFTSPIRRYPDLVVHRNLKWLIDGQEGPQPHLAEDLQRMCDHCSAQERAASQLERRIKDACLVLASLHDSAYSQSEARITGMTPASLFVKLASGIEARIRGRDLPGGPFAVDEWESMLYLSDIEAPQRFDPDELAQLAAWHDEELGESRRIRAILGDQIRVRLTGRDVAAGKTGAVIEAWK